VSRARGIAALLATLALAAGCATTAPNGPGADPFEPWNRKVFAINDKLDQVVLAPVARGYQKVVPEPVRRGVSNVFNNVADLWSGINNVLQGKGDAAGQDFGRVIVNTLFGLGGVFDVAEEAGIDHQYEDFGQTLGRWGFEPGPYLVWPLIGPSAVRESIAMPLDRGATPALGFHEGARWAVTGLSIVNTRASLLNASSLLDDIALDKYTFVRDAYLQRRRSLVYDGNPPQPPEETEPPADPAPRTPRN
jgi:phospholipid-binding lipoprotein MlaA